MTIVFFLFMKCFCCLEVGFLGIVSLIHAIRPILDYFSYHYYHHHHHYYQYMSLQCLINFLWYSSGRNGLVLQTSKASVSVITIQTFQMACHSWMKRKIVWEISIKLNKKPNLHRYCHCHNCHTIWHPRYSWISFSYLKLGSIWCYFVLLSVYFHLIYFVSFFKLLFLFCFLFSAFSFFEWKHGIRIISFFQIIHGSSRYLSTLIKINHVRLLSWWLESFLQ